ncbi:MAG TPA: HAMP domain-containing sensor histidine kinase [Polyangiaceae bacterium]
MLKSLGLRTRLFAWLLVAIVAGMCASAIAWTLLRSEVDSGPLRTMSRAVASELTADWGDPAAVDATVEHIRATTNPQVHLRRDVDALPRAVRSHRSSLVFDGGTAFIPIVHDGQVVGALEFPAETPPGRAIRRVVFLAVVLVVLAIAARSISGLVVRPLERVAEAAGQFGSGELAARAGDDRNASPEVRDVAKAFDAMATRVERMVRDQRDLLAAVSHELRSPLGRARVALELARDQGANQPALGRVETSIAELDVILGDLLSITRAGLSDLHKEPTALVDFLRKRVSNVDGARVVVSGDEALVASIDPALFGRAITNVVENARHHAGPGDVRITVEPRGARAVVCVRDRGPGLSSDLIEKAFDPFVRGDGARSRAQGHQSTGLGLAIVRRIVEAHGGSASIRNVEESGKVAGAEVTIDVPAA